MKLTERQQEFLDYLKTLHPTESTITIAKDLGITYQAVGDMIRKLERKGAIRINKNGDKRNLPIMLYVEFKETA